MCRDKSFVFIENSIIISKSSLFLDSLYLGENVFWSIISLIISSIFYA